MVFVYVCCVCIIHRGGTHVNYITDQVIKYVMDKIAKTDPELKVQPGHVRYHLPLILYNSALAGI